jgi:hypothetical protein
VQGLGGDHRLFHCLAIAGVSLEVASASGDEAPGDGGEAGAVVLGSFPEDVLGQELDGPWTLGCEDCGAGDRAQELAVWRRSCLDQVLKHEEAPPRSICEGPPFIRSCSQQERVVGPPSRLLGVVLQVYGAC